jgi:hypothetical protein
MREKSEAYIQFETGVSSFLNISVYHNYIRARKFGSTAGNREREPSDIDLAFLGGKSSVHPICLETYDSHC